MNPLGIFIVLILFVLCSSYDNLLLGRIAYEINPTNFVERNLTAVTDGSDATCLITRQSPSRAYIRYNLGQMYPIRTLKMLFRPSHIHRVTPFKIFFSNSSGGEDNLCYEWTDRTMLPSNPGTYSCAGFGQYISISSDRSDEDNLSGAWRSDEEFATMSFCELSIEGCLTYNRFGVNCSQTCYCKTFTCDYVTGACPGGLCADGWQGSTCSDRIGASTAIPTTTQSPSTNAPSVTPTSTPISTSLISETPGLSTFSPDTDAFISLSNGVGPGPVIAVVMVMICLIIVAGLIVFVGISFLKGKDSPSDTGILVKEQQL